MRCKVGDLVVVTCCHVLPENIGRFGVVEASTQGRLLHLDDWIVRPQNKFWGFNYNFPVENTDVVSFYDRDLCPIRPDCLPLSEQEVNKLLEPA